MNPTGQQPNPGSFMSASAGGQNGQGGALMRLMQLRGTGASPQQSAQPVTPAVPPTTQAIPQGMGTPPQQAAPAGQPGGGVMGDPELQIALNAMSQYIKSHGNVLEAKHDVHMKKAQASAVSRAQQQGGQ